MKILARDDRQRPQDFDDILALLLEAEPQDLGDARIALRLIEARGYQRGRVLLEELNRIIESNNPKGG